MASSDRSSAAWSNSPRFPHRTLHLLPWMDRGRWGFAVALLATFLLGGTATQGRSVMQLDLEGLCTRADRIIRATVLDISAGTVKAGGGEIPTVTYRLRVRETLGGAPAAVVDLTMVGSHKELPHPVAAPKRFPLFAEIPQLAKGGDYLLFTTKPSRIGLSTIVGLEQGCFRIFTQDKAEFAVNGANNVGLGLKLPSPTEYAALVQRIRDLLGK